MKNLPSSLNFGQFSNSGRCFPYAIHSLPHVSTSRKNPEANEHYLTLKVGILHTKSKFSLEEICHNFQDCSVDFEMMVAILTTWRSFGIVTFCLWNSPIQSENADSFLRAYQRAAGKSRWLHPTANKRAHLHPEQGPENHPALERAGATNPKASSLRPEPGHVGRSDCDWDMNLAQLFSNRHMLPPGSHYSLETGRLAHWGTQVEEWGWGPCAWSPENVPSISQLQKHLCPTAFSWTAVKIYSVRLLSEFLTSQPEAGWSQGCQWVAAGSERDHSFQCLDETWHKGIRGEPRALNAVNLHQLSIFLFSFF